MMDVIFYFVVMIGGLLAAFYLTLRAEDSAADPFENVVITTIELIGVLVAIGVACLAAWCLLAAIQ